MIIAGCWYRAVTLHPPADLPVAPAVLAPVRAASVRASSPAVFPHSVIPGGARSAAELTAALDRDPVAAAHYKGFRTFATRLEHLDRATVAYISYRIGDKVYWTRKAIVLPEGEAVLTDGENLARARCGNRISFGPRTPVGPDVDLDIPEVPPGGDEDFEANQAPDAFDLPLIVHNVFPPYFCSVMDAPAGEVDPTGGSGALGSFNNGSARGAGGGGGATPLLSREHDPFPRMLATPDPSAGPRIELPALLPNHAGPVFVWTGPSTMPGSGLPGALLTSLPGWNGLGWPGGGLPIFTVQGSTLATGGNHDGGGGSGAAPLPSGGGKITAGSSSTSTSQLIPGGTGVAADSDVPEPAVAVLLAAGVLALAARSYRRTADNAHRKVG